MKKLAQFEFPPELVPDFEKAKRLEWITIAYFISSALVIFLAMGNSQTMKTAWYDDVLSLTPPIAFQVASRVFMKAPNKQFPYGYHRVANIAYLCSAVALFALGAFLVIDSTLSLVKTEHPTIGTVIVGGHQIWLGYLMIAALLWSTIPSVILGRKKLPLAKHLHEKNLYTDADMNKADWMSGIAAMLGIVGIGLGWWWADSAAALLISVDIVHDGFTSLKQAVFDLMDQIPKTVATEQPDPLLEQVRETLAGQSWVKDFSFRMRECGHIYLGEGFVVPAQEENLIQHIANTAQTIEQLNWRIQEFVITPVPELPDDESA
ncbi:cation diffusion facilitator family transporter [Hymenobacter sp. GOD-10R]|uniref:cation diffusion facilitator family transporter n=1 Tax=Hymenobacter sp. GOD-10R TaxID=3093922 RepID=UPI002D7748F1|nr:cation diffusion facilitator family transporter [Hymenobacter sp. GOD-10R]WRQ31183.1 cation diffusion facilitator family transporter [Hymenobacter sp. GOD-10R]